MFDFNNIASSLENRVGFTSTVNTADVPSLPAALTTNESGLRVNDGISQYLIPEQLYDFLPNYELFQYDAWASGTTYSTGDYVKHNGVNYIALQASTGSEPGTPLAVNDWERVFINQLKKKRLEGIRFALQSLFKQHNLSRYQKTLFDSGTVYPAYSNAILKKKRGRFIGLSIVPLSPYLRFEIHQIGLHYTFAESVNLYLFHSSKTKALSTTALTIDPTETDTFVWKALNLKLSRFSDKHFTDGHFLIGFFENELSGQLAQWQQLGYGYLYGKDNFCMANIRPVEIDSTDLNGTDRPNLDEFNESVSTNDYLPFNLKASVKTDPSELFTRVPEQFDEVLQYSIAANLLKVMIDSVSLGRVNQKVEGAFQKLQFDLYGNKEQGIEGVQQKLEKAIKQASMNMEKLDPVFKSNNYLIEGRI